MKKKMLARIVSVVALTLLILSPTTAQDREERERYQAQLLGQGPQFGKTFNVTITINEYSTPEERQALLEAFQAKGSQGLFNALEKMKAKGRIAITGTLGYDISFARKIQTAEGWKIRVLTNRPIRFGEAWSDSRSSDYNLSAMEMDLNTSDKDKNGGVLFPACQFKVNKKTKEIEIEAFRSPWKIVQLLDRTKD
jgi:hypothetical protein